MCGISGFFPCADNNYNLSILKSMSDSLSHRGPDGDGVWCDNTIGLSHRRLSIFDLILGKQPMLSRSKRFVISYNGEVYNFKEIREHLLPPEDRWLSGKEAKKLWAKYDHERPDYDLYVKRMKAREKKEEKIAKEAALVEKKRLEEEAKMTKELEKIDKEAAIEDLKNLKKVR